jgi:predicted Zn-ribbon and HTH transcriptional regulator
MDNVCEECRSKKIAEGSLLNMSGPVGFYPEGEESKIKAKYSIVKCKACKDCGHIFDLRLVNSSNI